VGNTESEEQGEAKGSSTRAPRTGERLVVESGHVAVIDQFMLANPQLHTAREELASGGQSDVEALQQALSRYGGSSLALAPGTYQVLRDTEDTFLALVPADESDTSPEEVIEAAKESVRAVRDSAKAEAHVFVDTRCLAFLDAKLLEDQELIKQFAELRSSGNDKGARDLVRKRGGAVRYGFNKYGDELGAFRVQDVEMLALWPDVAE